jgi:hypothetical protein
MVVLTKRRTFLALPFLSACANDQPAGPFVPPGPPSYGHLTPLRLKVGSVGTRGTARGGRRVQELQVRDLSMVGRYARRT